MDALDTLLDLWNVPGVKDNLKESARLFFTSDAITVNLIPAALILLLGAFLLKPLLGIPILSQIFGAMTGGGASYGSNLEISDGYGAPSAGYGAPAPAYGAPAPAYGAPAPAYSEPSPGYDTPSTGYDTPTDGYSAGRRRREALPREAGELWADIQPYTDMQGRHGGYIQPAAFIHSQAEAVGSVQNLLH